MSGKRDQKKSAKAQAENHRLGRYRGRPMSNAS
jgi:hypothetical protein